MESKKIYMMLSLGVALFQIQKYYYSKTLPDLRPWKMYTRVPKHYDLRVSLSE